MVQGVERLDGALKRREPAEAIAPQVQRLQQQLRGIADAAARIEDVR